jgi:hypothetical protein
MAGVFISYRPEDAGWGLRIRDRLRNIVVPEFVISSSDDPEPHVQCAIRLAKRVGEPESLEIVVVVAIVGASWLSGILNHPDDPVRAEIEAALKHGIAVIPVVVDGASMPGPDALPSELKYFGLNTGTVYTNSARLDSDMEQLVEWLESYLTLEVLRRTDWVFSAFEGIRLKRQPSQATPFGSRTPINASFSIKEMADFGSARHPTVLSERDLKQVGIAPAAGISHNPLVPKKTGRAAKTKRRTAKKRLPPQLPESRRPGPKSPRPLQPPAPPKRLWNAPSSVLPPRRLARRSSSRCSCIWRTRRNVRVSSRPPWTNRRN